MIRTWISDSSGASLTKTAPDQLEKALWIDLADPDASEIAKVEASLSFALPPHQDLYGIEPSSRTYCDANACYLTALVASGLQSGQPMAAPVGFILTRGGQLVTLRYSEHPAFDNIISCRQHLSGQTAGAILLSILEHLVDHAADGLERLAIDINQVGERIFDFGSGPRTGRLSPRELEELLRNIGAIQLSLSRVRESLQTLARMLLFLGLPSGLHHGINLLPREHQLLKSLEQDVAGLTTHTDYLLQNVYFLLDSSVGRISIEQNAIVKALSLASVVFLPPTLIGSIYGMNFKHMPELQHAAAYPLTLLAMLVAAVLPYSIFKLKGWL